MGQHMGQNKCACTHAHTHTRAHTKLILYLPVVFSASFTDVPSRILEIREKGRPFRLDSQPPVGW